MKMIKYKNSDLDKIWNIISVSFGVKDSFKEFIKKELSHFKGYYIEEAGLPAAAAFYGMYEMNFFGVTVKVPGISFVCTLPEFRNRGYVRALLERMLKDFISMRYPFSTLYAFKMQYYRKFGWGYMCESRRYEIPPEIIGRPQEKGLYGIEYLSEEKIKDYVGYFNQEHFPKYHGSFKKAVHREKHYRDFSIEGKGVSLYKMCAMKKGGKIKGVFTFGIDQEKKLNIYEAFWSDRTALFTLLNFMANFRDQSKEIIISLAPDQRMEYLMETTYFSKEIKTRQMGRIVSLPDFVKLIDLEDGEYELNVRDAQCAGNTGRFIISRSRGKTRIVKKPLSGPALELSVLTGLIFLEDMRGMYTSNAMVSPSAAKFLRAMKGIKPSHVTEFY